MYLTGLSTVLNILGSLGVFLFGMKIMSDGIQKVAGSRLRDILSYMTQNRVAGVFTGFLTTCLVQSSSATTVMVVSFVNAGLLTFTESIGVIMGANIGTTLTGWLIAVLGFKFKISSIALPAVGIGLPLIFSKITKRKNIGEIFIGFGLLFLGLKFLKQSVPNIKDNPEILQFLQSYTDMGLFSVFLFIGVGVLLTIIVQSSSAAMAITITMAYSGWIDFPTACALILGENIGTTITAYLASLSANYQAKRAARAHMIFNVIGVVWMIIAFKFFVIFVDDYIVPNEVPYISTFFKEKSIRFKSIEDSGYYEGSCTLDVVDEGKCKEIGWDWERRDYPERYKTDISQKDICSKNVTKEECANIGGIWDESHPRENIPVHLSMFHTLFNILNVLLMIWFVPQIASLVKKMIRPTDKDKKEEDYKLEYFSANVQPIPEIAMIEAKKEVLKMSTIINQFLSSGYNIFIDKEKPMSIDEARRVETLTDQMQVEISNYLSECTKHELSMSSSKNASDMIRIVNELESIGDSTLNLFLLNEKLGSKTLNKEMKNQIIELFDKICEFTDWNHSFIDENIKKMSDEDLKKSINYENEIDEMRNKLIGISASRLSKDSNSESELIFIDVVKHLEHIGDFSLNISQALQD